MDTDTKSGRIEAVGLLGLLLLCICSATVGIRLVTLGGITSGALAYQENSNPVRQVIPGDLTQTIPLVEPRGLNPERDQQYADVNKTNAEAYKTGAEGYSAITDSNAQATLTVAQACAIRNDCTSENVVRHPVSFSDAMKNLLAAGGLVMGASLLLFITFRRKV